MPTNLTGQTIASSYDQLLHVDDGPTAGEKIVYSGTGVATALSIGTGSASVDNIRFDGNTISTLDTNGNLTLAPNGTGSVNASKVAITGGTITGITNLVATGGTITGITDLAVADGGTGASNAAGARTSLGIGTSGTFDVAYALFYDADTADQVGSPTAATATEFATAAIVGSGITVVSNTRITFAAAGTYRLNASIQFGNSGGVDRYVDVWYAKNGVNLPSSNGRVAVPKVSDGGTYLLAYETFETVTAGQYMELCWCPENVSVTMSFRPAVAANPGVTPAIPATPPAIIVVQRVA